ncbi:MULTISPECIES: hypothetical protein [unclassified Cytobacillus]|uniref:hypothetical protein n=1 Tax=unclassified Cytobacillus TaxID=2675268 RepID=UPI0013FBE59F|nr:hypothetical protein [Cytobacillus sp. AMY 15.2]KAF0821050.1 hypothetical protein KIS4809_0577 [Bacillus sp. ZZV12-4809]MCM3091004.1 hypothetical protein [Cytobacillus sp. AMY 15.2]
MVKKGWDGLRRLIKVSNIVFLLFLMAGCSVPKPNVDNFQELHTVYGKTLQQLEDEWREFVQEKPVPNEELLHSNNSQLPGIINHLAVNKSSLLNEFY